MRYLDTSLLVAAFTAERRTTDVQADGIRAGDALHLAITLRAGATLQTLDGKLGEQAMDVGVSVGVELNNGA